MLTGRALLVLIGALLADLVLSVGNIAQGQ